MNKTKTQLLAYFFLITPFITIGQAGNCPTKTTYGSGSTDPIFAHYSNPNLGFTTFIIDDEESQFGTITIFGTFLTLPFLEECTPPDEINLTINLYEDDQGNIGETLLKKNLDAEIFEIDQTIDFNVSNIVTERKLYKIQIPLDTIYDTNTTWIDISNSAPACWMMITSSGKDGKIAYKTPGGDWEHRNTEFFPDICLTSTLSSSIDLQDQIKLSISPNPSSEFITLKSDYPLENIVIRSFDGSLVFKSFSNSTQLDIDLSKIKRGIYIVTVQNKKFTSSKKLIHHR